MKKLINKVLVFALMLIVFPFGACAPQYENSKINETSFSNKSNETNNSSSDTALDSNSGEVVLTISVQASYKTKPTPDYLYNRADLVVVATYKEDVRTVCDQWGRPQTTTRFTVLEVIKGEAAPDTTVSVTYTGGRVTLYEYMKTQNPESLKKQGVNSTLISEEEAKELYVEYVNVDAPMPYFKNEGQKFILFLCFLPDKTDAAYVTAEGGGWAVLKVNEENLVYSHFSKTYETISFYEPGSRK